MKWNCPHSHRFLEIYVGSWEITCLFLMLASAFWSNQLNPGKPLRFRWSSCKLGCIQCQYGPGHSGIRLQAQWKIRIGVDMNSHPWTPNSEWWLMIKKWHQYLPDYISKDKSMYLQKNLSPPPAFPIMALLVRKSLRWPHAVHRFDVQLQGSWPGVKSWVHDIGDETSWNELPFGVRSQWRSGIASWFLHEQIAV